MDDLLAVLLLATDLFLVCVLGVLLAVPSWHRWGIRFTSAGLAVVLVAWIGGRVLLETQDLFWRPWLYTTLLCLAGLLFLVLCLWCLTAVCRWRGLRRAVKCLVSLSGVLALLHGGFLFLLLFGFTTFQETTGEWNGSRVVMVDESALHARYSYYQYRGPLCMGPLLGRSDDAWGEPYWMVNPKSDSGDML